jgi:uncharacterized protein
MHPTPETRCTAFAGTRRIASGELRHVALVAQREALHGRADAETILIFDDRSSARIELDLRGSSADLLRRLSDQGAALAPEGEEGASLARRRGPGRPRLGVVAREVTLLPRHWQWLNAQPGGASVALRRLVEEARRTHTDRDRRRAAQEAAYRFMSAIAGDAPGFEDATRALFAGDAVAFEERIAAWPEDVRDHAALLATAAFQD